MNRHQTRAFGGGAPHVTTGPIKSLPVVGDHDEIARGRPIELPEL